MKQLFIKMIRNNTVKIEIYENSSVETLAKSIQDKVGIPYWKQRILYRGKQLPSNGLLKKYNIKKTDYLELQVSLNGANAYTLLNLKTTFGSTEIPFTGGTIKNDGKYVQFDFDVKQ